MIGDTQLTKVLCLNLREITLQPVATTDEARFQALLQAHHYRGALPKIGHTLWYVVSWRGQWLALLSFSAPAWKYAARDRWIGWDFRHQYDRLHLIANNSRFLILRGWHVPNLASRILSLCERRLAQDWCERFGHPLWLLETFVDPRYFHGTVYRAANWLYVGDTRGFRRTREGYSTTAQAPKRVFVRPLVARAQARLSQPVLDPVYRHGAPKLMLSAEHMRSLPALFADTPDPRRPQGRRHPLPVVLAISTAAVLCGARGHKAISAGAQDLGQKARTRCRCRNGRYEVPSRTLIRDVLTRVDPVLLDRAVQGWNVQYADTDEALAVDGRTMCSPSKTTSQPCQPTSACSSKTGANPLGGLALPGASPVQRGNGETAHKPLWSRRSAVRRIRRNSAPRAGRTRAGASAQSARGVFSEQRISVQ